MENEKSCDRNLLVDVLTQGEELTKQLEAHLDEHSASELCKSLAHKIQSTITTAISMATEGSHQLACPNNTGSDSPRSDSESPRSENSDRAFRVHERREMSKKRKTLPKWTSQVRVSAGAGIEAPLYDGYSWRKYGQKDILGAKHPRGYFRCTHRNAQGCLATKLVQRSDEDPSIFDVTYRGAHTCLQRPRLVPTPQNQHNPPPGQGQQQQDQKLLPSFGTGLQVETQSMDSTDQDPASSSFSFPSTPISYIKPETHAFSSSSVLDNHLMGSFSPTFVSTTTSESTYFSLSQCGMTSYGGVQSDHTEIVSAATTAVNSPIVNMDFVLDPVDLDTNFPFDATNFL